MVIIGLDPGIHTGWAVCRHGRILESGVQTFALARGESPGMRFLRFRRWLAEVAEKAGLEVPDLPRGHGFKHDAIFAYEHSFQQGSHAQELFHGWTTRLQEIAAERGSESLPVHTGTLKKWATGSGRADKAAMRAVAARRTGRYPESNVIGDEGMSEDEADAILVALYAWEQVKP